MKRYLTALLIAACALGAQAGGDWKVRLVNVHAPAAVEGATCADEPRGIVLIPDRGVRHIEVML